MGFIYGVVASGCAANSLGLGLTLQVSVSSMPELEGQDQTQEKVPLFLPPCNYRGLASL